MTTLCKTGMKSGLAMSEMSRSNITLCGIFPYLACTNHGQDSYDTFMQIAGHHGRFCVALCNGRCSI